MEVKIIQSVDVSKPQIGSIGDKWSKKDDSWM